MLVAVNGVPATASVELASSSSYICRRFVGCPSQGEYYHCRLFSAVENGLSFFTDIDLAIRDALASDVVLGSDWYRLAQSTGSVSSVLPSNDRGSGDSFCRLHSVEDAVHSDCSFQSSQHETNRDFNTWNRPSQVDGAVVDQEDEASATSPSSGIDVTSAQPGYAIVYANFFGKNRRQPCSNLNRSSLFASSLDILQQLMNLHGLDTSDDVDTCRCMLIRHFINGDCVSSTASACRMVAEGFSSSRDLAMRLLRDLSEIKAAKSWPTSHLRIIARALKIPDQDFNIRRNIQNQLSEKLRVLESLADCRPELLDILHAFERHTRPVLLSICSSHNIPVTTKDPNESLRCAIIRHLVVGECRQLQGKDCTALREQWLSSACGDTWIIFFLSRMIERQIVLRPLQRILKACNIPFKCEDSLGQLRSTLKSYIKTLRKGKLSIRAEIDGKESATYASWPKIPEQSLKDRLIRMFVEETSSSALETVVCAACSETVLKKEIRTLTSAEFDLQLLSRPDLRMEDDDESSPWLHACAQFHPPMPLANHESFQHLRDYLLNPDGILGLDDDGSIRLHCCDTCASSLMSGSTPPLSWANRTFIGPVPDELKELTVIEEAMIARCRAKCWIIQLKEEYSKLELPNSQRGVRGHIIIYPQNPSNIANLLPPPIDEITSPICVLFVGSHPPSAEWLREKAKPLAVRPHIVRRALTWLKTHNPLYKDIVINEPVLQQLGDDQILPFAVQYIESSAGSDCQTSGYDNTATPSTSHPRERDAPWQNVVITNVDGSASANSLRSAALRHVKEKGGGYIQIPHDELPVNEFVDPSLFPMIYPTLFPYGIGGFRDSDRDTPLSMQRHVRHLFNIDDRRFQEHYSFLFTAFNMLQRHSILLHTKLKTQKSNFDKLADSLSSIDAETVHSVIERMSRGETTNSSWTPNETKLFSLMREVTAITSNIPGSASARTTMRNEIRALMVDKGLPNFYITINPADVYNPIVKFLAGAEINIDNLLDEHVPSYWDQSILVAKNPAVSAKFFNVYMKAFISCLLRYNHSVEIQEEGVLGVVKAYYGCVEAQGRGTLHCHMLVWIEGGLNPNQLKDKILSDEEFARNLIAYLDDAISNEIPGYANEPVDVPSDKHHPCSVRPVHCDDTERSKIMRLKDVSNVIRQCQLHTHSHTCYKYFKGEPGELKQCRFNLGEHTRQPESFFDRETGELSLRRVDGLVNNYNTTMIEALRCNMDIQFIGSGTSAKAIVYYITDYITKTMLKTHVGYSALELAIRQLGEFNPHEDDATTRAKTMLRKCAYTLLSHQELSAPQVASYLMGYEDHFKSHGFVTLYWPSCERLINNEWPSPECQLVKVSQSCKASASNSVSMDRDDIEIGIDGVSGQDGLDEYEPAVAEADAEDPEVIITVTARGDLVASTDFVNDYRYRGDALLHMNIWEFRARVQKVKKSKNQRDIADLCDSSTIVGRKYIFVPLLSDHEQAGSHILRVTPAIGRLVPIPMGPKIPRRDSTETLPRFCRLMLILFKPWRRASDLRRSDENWNTAYDHFIEQSDPDILGKIENTQILHECRDSRDIHFEERRRKTAALHTHADDVRAEPDTFGPEVSTDEVLRHLQQIDACYSNKVQANDTRKLECLKYAQASGLFAKVPTSPAAFPLEDDGDKSITLVESPALEDSWELEYEKRRNAWKRVAANVSLPAMGSTVEVTSNTTVQISDGSDLRNCQSAEPFTNQSILTEVVPFIHLPHNSNKEDKYEIIRSVAAKWTLNKEQTRAFKILTEHSCESNNEQLRMYLAGAGGAGKSRVIDAWHDFFDIVGESRRIRKAAFTGVAARNISGVTLHSALLLNQRTKKGVQSHTLRDLIAIWEGVDYLIVDEVSMIGCLLMYEVSAALNDAKSSSRPFGGINIVFAGDFGQLPPVCETRLYAHQKLSSKGNAVDQNRILGRLLWLSTDTVVILEEIKRQSGSENTRFVELLSRLRVGQCTPADYALLKTRLLLSSAPDALVRNPPPIIVVQNTVKDYLNESGAESFAYRTKRELHWYYSVDKIKGNVITDTELRRYLRGKSTNQTCQRLGRIPMVIGMPVMITQNFDVENGIVNGTMGILKRIRYVVDNDGERHAKSCIVGIKGLKGPKIPGLEEGEAAVIEDTVSMSFRHPFSGKNCTIRRTQLPLVPAFSITAHKSQGQTLEQVIVDLEDCRGTEAPYVMLSRVKSLDGLYIIRPFALERICSRQSQDVRMEFKRLEILRLQTIQKYGSEEEKAEARNMLKGSTLTFGALSKIDPSDSNNRELLIDIQRSIVDQTQALDGECRSHISNIKKRKLTDSQTVLPRKVRQRIL